MVSVATVLFNRQFQYILDDDTHEVTPGEKYMMSLTSQGRYSSIM